MKIRKLNIKSFGKFKNKEIEFKDGLNIVYGNNEAGKSTTHRFIQGIFFGFFKPYSKNKIYTKEYVRFKPWNSNLYKGSLEFNIGKREYRIERNFDKKNEDFKLFDNITGEDLTDKLPYDASTKQRIISPVIKLNSVLYNNTISIAQLGNKTEKDFKREISEALANYEKGNNNKISVNKALGYLEKQKADIGTRKQSKSNYGSAVIKLEELKKSKEKAILAMEENKEHYLEANRLEEQLRELKKKKRDILNDINSVARNREKVIYFKYKSVEDENKKIREKIEELKKYRDINNELYTEFLNLNSENKALHEQIDELNKKQEYVNSALSSLDDEAKEVNKETKGKDYNRIISDIEILKDRLGNIERLKGRLSQKKDVKVEKDYSAKTTTNKVINILCVVTAVISAFMLAFSFTISKALLLYFYISLGAAAICLIMKLVIMSVYKETSKKYEKYDTSLIRTQNMIELNEVEINKILMDYEEEDPYKLIEILEEKSIVAKEASQNQNRLEKYKMDLEDFEGTGKILEEKISNNAYKMNEILIKNNISSVEEFKDALEKREEYDRLIDRYESNNKLLMNIIDGNDINLLAEKFKDETVDEDTLKKINGVNNDFLSESADTVNDEITKISAELSRIKGILEESNSFNENLCVINEDINKYETRIKEYEFKLLALEKAIDTINSISKDIHTSVAPRINETLGLIMSKITKGKYSTVKVNDNMDVMVLDEESGQMVDAESLSNGTIDQIYLALRFSIIDNLLLNSKMPIILDDCFVQYDDYRVKEVLSYLESVSEEKQIIIFTCHTREEKALDELGLKYNKITL
ncbi:ATP-binding protein [Anaerofustis sp.]|uniref:ATP-binding protein n=1 Tax=Anaerofustis sp. TaxID=1872517 RepID=UPI0025BD5CB3|nr:AAA family ATPase [Anaerofustis sp.]